jgi:peptidoglycan hydrolase-like protein with peptidoglycan-binding domain
MRKFFINLFRLFALFLFFILSHQHVLANYKDTYTITGYYSPLSDQSFYVTGSYDSDRILNGNGTNGACGEQVFPGLIAAPSNFQFGTKISIPGFGTGRVCDRGGAIKNKRLDVWFGFGEDGLKRALAWGKRTLDVVIYDELESKTIKEQVFFDLAKSANEYIDKILSAISDSHSSETSVTLKKFIKDLGLNSSGEDVKFLQETLNSFGYLKEGNISSNFDLLTRSAVINYQIGKDIVDGADSFGAGFVGPQTRINLEKDYKLFQEGKYLKPINYLEEANKYSDLAETPVYFSKQLSFGSKGDDVKLLQETLKKLGYLRIEPSGYFGEVTENAVKRFQLKIGLIDDIDSPGAGVLGSRTMSYLSSLTDKRIEVKGLIAARRQKDDELEILVTKPKQNNDKKVNIFETEIDYGENSENVKSLQEILKKLGYFKGNFVSTYYGDSTKEAVIAFQLDKGIISNINDLGAGRVGPKTLALLKDINS